ncbi:MAG TPA: hypothetical protein VI386_31795 [Candidatus Sulfotelmatobacter sp.]
MKQSRPLIQSFVHFAAIAVFATSVATPVLAETPKSVSPKYDVSTESTLKGSIEELKLVPPTGGKAIAYLTMKTGPDSHQVYLCPQSFLDQMGVSFKAGDEIQLTGSKITQTGAELTLAREVVTKSGDTLTLRFKDGKPAW